MKSSALRLERQIMSKESDAIAAARSGWYCPWDDLALCINCNHAFNGTATDSCPRCGSANHAKPSAWVEGRAPLPIDRGEAAELMRSRGKEEE